MKSTLAILMIVLVSPLAMTADSPDFDAEPWLRPRALENFKSLLDRSPFSLPTAEENTAIAERFVLTGAATINDRPVVFVFDKNTQNRLMLEKADDANNGSRDQLLELFQAPDPKNLRASVQIEGQRTEIRFAEDSFAAPAGQPMPPQAAVPGAHIPPQPPVPGQQQPGVVPGQQQAAVQPGNNSNSQPPRRVIRRRVISGQPPAAQPIPGQ